ncbi:MAG: tocopherol cyclase family protein [Anaerolineae bacterium]|nr:tocopherol cyclase family protein [Anaerolineae bacterium]
MRQYIYKTLHPHIFQGTHTRRPYFEGWYFKLISADEQTRYAIIPGIFRGQDTAKDHAFIQVLDGMNGRATYHEYPTSAFWADKKEFIVRVGASEFSLDGVKLDIDDDLLTLKGTVTFSRGRGWDVTPMQPGVMGWYMWLPIMECYHGIVNLSASLNGGWVENGKTVSFVGGKGYVEKDWGQAFPSAYIWMQSNHFDTPNTSLTASIAMIPLLGRSFRGAIVGFYYQDTLYKFAKYTNAINEQLKLTDDHVYWTMRNKTHRLELVAERISGGLLLAPIRTEMHKRVDETMQSTVKVRLTTLAGDVIFDEIGRNTALEVHGDLDTLLKAK